MQASKSLTLARRLISRRATHHITTSTACLSTFVTCRPSQNSIYFLPSFLPIARRTPSCLHSHVPTRPTRTFFSSSHLHNDPHKTPAEPPTSFADPTRPDLFYHLVFLERNSITHSPFSSDVDAGDIPVFAVSLLERPPPFAASSTVLGWLPAEGGGAEDGAEDGGEGEGGVGLNDFTENPAFRPLLHEAISSGLTDGVDDIQMNGALQTQSGWMHINDTRNIPALGRIGDPDDILGSVRVEEGKIMPETYSPMPSYRVCTGDGVTKLTDGLAERLREVLERRAMEEEERE